MAVKSRNWSWQVSSEWDRSHHSGLLMRLRGINAFFVHHKWWWRDLLCTMRLRTQPSELCRQFSQWTVEVRNCFVQIKVIIILAKMAANIPGSACWCYVPMFGIRLTGSATFHWPFTHIVCSPHLHWGVCPLSSSCMVVLPRSHPSQLPQPMTHHRTNPSYMQTGQATWLCEVKFCRGSTPAEEFRCPQYTGTTFQCWWSSMAVHSHCR